MVAFKMKLKTPEYPKGRDIVLICNDITHKIGSFGPEEDLVFLRASELARAEGIPRIYIAANSGARIGFADEIKHMFQVAWVDPEDPYKVRGHLSSCHHRALIWGRTRAKPGDKTVGSMPGCEPTLAPSTTGKVPSAFSGGMETKTPVLARLLCPALVPELLLMHGTGLGWGWRGTLSHVSCARGTPQLMLLSLFSGVQVPVPDSPGLHEDQCHELSAL